MWVVLSSEVSYTDWNEIVGGRTKVKAKVDLKMRSGDMYMQDGAAALVFCSLQGDDVTCGNRTDHTPRSANGTCCCVFWLHHRRDRRGIKDTP